MPRDDPSSVSRVRRRFHELAGALGEIRELARASAAGVEDLRAQLSAQAATQTILRARLDALHGEMHALLAANRTLAERLGTSDGHADPAADRRHRDLMEALRWIHANEATYRRLLREARVTPGYERPFVDRKPLISVLIATYDGLETLRARSLPSIFAQDYSNFELVIVGDSAAYDASDVVSGFDADRIRFVNRTIRGPYPDDPQRRRRVAGAPPLNEALQLARGGWLAIFSDDDAMRPGHLRMLLAEAQRRRLEFVYGKLQRHGDGPETLGVFPPRQGQIGLQASLLHRGLAFFELELADAAFGVPSDWGHIERMMRAGVRMGMIDAVVTDGFPSGRARNSD